MVQKQNRLIHQIVVSKIAYMSRVVGAGH